MSHFTRCTADLFRDIGTHLPFVRLNATDRYRLIAAYVRDCPGTVRQVLDSATGTTGLAEQIARIIEMPRAPGNDVDTEELIYHLWTAIRANSDLMDLAAAAYEMRRRECEQGKHAVVA